MVSDKTPRKRTTYSLATIAKAKALYLVKGLGPTEICERLNVPPDTLRNWTQRGNWTAERKARIIRLEQAALTRAHDENSAFLESMATQAEELAEDGMQLAREHVTSSSEFAARNFQSASQGIKNMVDVYFRARGIDAKNTGSATINVQALFVSSAPIAREEKTVVELGKVDHPQVME
jgi:transposase-like protein